MLEHALNAPEAAAREHRGLGSPALAGPSSVGSGMYARLFGRGSAIASVPMAADKTQASQETASASAGYARAGAVVLKRRMSWVSPSQPKVNA